MRFSAVGDFGATSNTAAVLSDIKARGDDLTLALGDMSYGTVGTEPTWCDFVSSRLAPGYPFELLAGNHESNGLNGNINDFASCLPNQLPGVIGTYGRQYYVDVPKTNPLVRYVMISPGLTYPDGAWSYAAGSPRYQWTAGAIDGARAAGIPWVVVGMHKPCLSTGQYTCEPGAAITNLLVEKKVDLVLSGHEHLYERTKQLGFGAGCSALVPASYNAACVVDSDSALGKGAGTVFATVGTGGVSLRNLNPTDPEAPYFANGSGLNYKPSYGSLALTATADSLSASFTSTAGGTFSDAFTIAAAAPPANQPPTASFTSSCTSLTCTFDASGSADADGSIASYLWSFGDGGTATTATPSHTYAAAGTYPVQLQVTDNGGATALTSGSVTVSQPSPTALAQDGFGRTVASGWGTADIGGAWSANNATATSVVDGAGQVSIAAGGTVITRLGNTGASSLDYQATFSIDKLPVGGSGIYLTHILRRTGAPGEYRAKLRILPTGVGYLSLNKLVGSVETSLQGETRVPGVFTPNTTWTLRGQAAGLSPTTVQAKAWPSASAEPATWLRSVTDSEAGLQATGGVGLSTYLSGATTNAPILVRMDNLVVTAP